MKYLAIHDLKREFIPLEKQNTYLLKVTEVRLHWGSVADN